MSKHDNIEASRARLERLERETLERLHELHKETKGRIAELSELEKILVFCAAKDAADRWKDATGRDELPPKVKALLAEFIEEGVERADMLADADSLNQRLAERGVRSLYKHQEVRANERKVREGYQQANRKHSKEKYQATVDRLHQENPELGWKRLKSLAALELGVSESTIKKNTENPRG